MNHRAAFTLVEMILASALMVLLMLGVMGVITRVGFAVTPPQSAEGGIGANDHPLEMWTDLLNRELNSVLKVEACEDNRLEWVCTTHLSASNLRITDRPVRVHYTVERMGGDNWLVRRQWALDVLDNRGPMVEWVVRGVSRFAFERTSWDSAGATVAPEISSQPVPTQSASTTGVTGQAETAPAADGKQSQQSKTRKPAQKTLDYRIDAGLAVPLYEEDHRPQAAPAGRNEPVAGTTEPATPSQSRGSIGLATQTQTTPAAPPQPQRGIAGTAWQLKVWGPLSDGPVFERVIGRAVEVTR